jgi:SOS response regulatory protein OraA/RecX
MKDYGNLPFECKPDSRLENIIIDVKKIESSETNQYFDGDCVNFLVFLSRKYTIYRSAITKVALTDIPKKQLFQKLYFAIHQNYKNHANTNKYKNNINNDSNQNPEIEPETLKILCGLVCDEFEASGYINDRRYALDKAKYLKDSKKYGNGRIKEYLYQKGIPTDITNEILEDEFFSDEDVELENMRNLLKKKYGENLNRLDKSDRNAIQKAINMLIRNGYKYQAAKNAVFDLIEDENIDFKYSTEDEEDLYDE